MSNIDVLEKLGSLIRSFFENPKNEEYYLCVDEYLFAFFLKCLEDNYHISENSVYSALSDLRCECFNKPDVAIAIATYQVVVFYTLDVNTTSDAKTTSDAYNERLFSSKAYKGLTYQDYWYNGAQYAPKENEALQEKLWSLIKRTFRIKSIPEPMGFGARDRYVQYPKSQNLLGSSMRSFKIKFADRFIQYGLEPNQSITYENFEKMIFNQNEYKDNIILRWLVFSFYCMWDGRDYRQLLNHVSKEDIEKRAKEEFLIKLQPEIKIYINENLIDVSNVSINDKYLWKFDVNNLLSRKGKVFIQDNDYKDWLPKYRNTIEEDDEVLLITEQTSFPEYIEKFIDEEKMEVFEIGKYKLLLLTGFSREEYDKLGIDVKSISYLSLLGGLKVRRNTYYDFALPIIKLNDFENSGNYHEVYIDAKGYPIKDGIVIIPTGLKAGKHCVKLSNSWNSSEIIFSVETVDNAEIPNNHGWYVNFLKSEVLPILQDSKKTIDGLKYYAGLNWIQGKMIEQFDASLRCFLQQNEKLLNRFGRTGNKKINERERYGI